MNSKLRRCFVFYFQVMNKERKRVRQDLLRKYLEIELMVNTNHDAIVQRLDCPRNIYFVTHKAGSVSIILDSFK